VSPGTQISPTGYLGPDRGAQINSVAVNKNGLAVAAWDQFNGEAVGTVTVNGVVMPVMWQADSTSPIDLNANQAISAGTMINLRVIDIYEAGRVLVDYLDSQYNRITDLLQPIG